MFFIMQVPHTICSESAQLVTASISVTSEWTSEWVRGREDERMREGGEEEEESVSQSRSVAYSRDNIAAQPSQQVSEGYAHNPHAHRFHRFHRLHRLHRPLIRY